MKRQIAIALMTKTPGFSPVKTRLAAKVGTQAAENFYELCLAAMRGSMRALQEPANEEIEFCPIWAVAEKEALQDERWRDWRCLWQGSGSLGERLAHVYGSLRACYDEVLVVGMDTPHLAANDYLQAASALAANTFVLGPSQDGGFYLFGGKEDLPAAVWTEIEYSASTTAAALAQAVREHGTLATLAPLQDIDQKEDFPQLLLELAQRKQEGALSAVVSFYKALT